MYRFFQPQSFQGKKIDLTILFSDAVKNIRKKISQHPKLSILGLTPIFALAGNLSVEGVQLHEFTDLIAFLTVDINGFLAIDPLARRMGNVTRNSMKTFSELATITLREFKHRPRRAAAYSLAGAALVLAYILREQPEPRRILALLIGSLGAGGLIASARIENNRVHQAGVFTSSLALLASCIMTGQPYQTVQGLVSVSRTAAASAIDIHDNKARILTQALAIAALMLVFFGFLKPKDAEDYLPLMTSSLAATGAMIPENIGRYARPFYIGGTSISSYYSFTDNQPMPEVGVPMAILFLTYCHMFLERDLPLIFDDVIEMLDNNKETQLLVNKMLNTSSMPEWNEASILDYLERLGYEIPELYDAEGAENLHLEFSSK